MVALGTVGTRVSTGIRSAGVERWDELARTGSFYLSSDWLLAWEEHEGRPIEVLTASDESGRLLAALPLLDATDNRRYQLAWLFGSLLPRAGDRRQPQLVGGGNAGYCGGVLCDPHLDGAARRHVLGALGDAFFALAAERGCPIAAIPYLERSALADLVPRRTAGVAPLVCGVAARMDVTWPDFDAYVASLSKPARRMLRQDVRAFAEAGHEIVLDRLSPWIDAIAPLLGAVQAQREFSSCSDPADYLRLCARGGLDDRSLLFLACRAGRPHAFVLAYEHAGGLYPRVLGLDLAVSRDHGLYFNTYFYALIRHALDRRLRTIDFGLEAYEAKLRRGAHAEVLWSLTRLPAGSGSAAGWNERWRASWTAEHGAHAGSPGADAWAAPEVPPTPTHPLRGGGQRRGSS